MDIKLPDVKEPDVYSFGFDKGLYRTTDILFSQDFNQTFQDYISRTIIGKEVVMGEDDDIFVVSKDGIHLGNKIFDSAPFRVNMDGDVTASSITITGGTIGGTPVDQIGNSANSTADIVPTNLAVDSTGITIAGDGTVSAYVVLSWTAISSNTFDYYLLRFKKNSFIYYTNLSTKETTITIDGLTPNTAYNFGIASVNKYGIQSSFSTDVNQTTAASTTAPATVTGVSATGGIQYVVLEWTSNSETDIASYNIYRNTINNSGTASLIANIRTNYFVDGDKTGGTEYFYWVKAINTSGLESVAFSTVDSATPRNVTSDDIVTIAGSKVLIDGATYLSNWRKTGDLTKIDGGEISTNTITTTQLNFTPVQDSNVIASINASAEGITIDADNITISGSTTFSAGYDPTYKRTVFSAEPTTPYLVGDLWTDGTFLKRCITALATGAYNAAHWELATGYTDDTVANTKITTFAQDAIPTSVSAGDMWIDTNDGNKLYRAVIAGADEITAGEWVTVPDQNKLGGTGSSAVGGSYGSAVSGARVLIFPDANTGIQVIDDDSNDVFKAVVGGANIGDVIIGDYSGGQGIFYDKSADTTTFAGLLGSLTIASSGHIKQGQTAYDTGTGFWLGDDSGTTKFSLGDSLNNIRWDGASLLIYGMPQFGQYFVIGSQNDGMNEITSGTASITRDFVHTIIKTGTTNDSVGRLESDASSTLSLSDLTTFRGKIGFNITIGTLFPTVAGPANCFAFVGICGASSTMSTTGVSSTNQHIGFYIKAQDGQYPEVLATNADGSTQTTTSIGQVSSPATRFRFEKRASDEIRFYRDDVLVATHTTNIYHQLTAYTIEMSVGNNDSSTDTRLVVGNNYQIIVN